jgi:hypothetical protein
LQFAFYPSQAANMDAEYNVMFVRISKICNSFSEPMNLGIEVLSSPFTEKHAEWLLQVTDCHISALPFVPRRHHIAIEFQADVDGSESM